MGEKIALIEQNIFVELVEIVSEIPNVNLFKSIF
jgi:hypothetical protein